MKLAIIDIGSKSIKHYIFDVGDKGSELLYYKRNSEAGLGETSLDKLNEDTIKRNLDILRECLKLNQSNKVSKCKLFGTEVLRKAHNSSDFAEEVSNLFSSPIEVLSHEKEALYLYKGFVDLVPKGSKFCAINIGGGTIEIVIGDKSSFTKSYEIPFGVKFLRENFVDKKDWDGLIKYANDNIKIEPVRLGSGLRPVRPNSGLKKENIDFFITGTLDFISTVGPKLGLKIVKNTRNILRHPIKLSMKAYGDFADLLRKTPIEELRKLYKKDPKFADNFAISQTVYHIVAEKIGVNEVIPSANDLTDGIIYKLSSNN